MARSAIRRMIERTRGRLDVGDSAAVVEEVRETAADLLGDIVGARPVEQKEQPLTRAEIVSMIEAALIRAAQPTPKAKAKRKKRASRTR